MPLRFGEADGSLDGRLGGWPRGWASNFCKRRGPSLVRAVH